MMERKNSRDGCAFGRFPLVEIVFVSVGGGVKGYLVLAGVTACLQPVYQGQDGSFNLPPKLAGFLVNEKFA
jgi:hypothetical protein